MVICFRLNGESAKSAPSFLAFRSPFKCINKSMFKIAINENGMNEYKNECTLKIEFKIKKINTKKFNN